MVFFIGKINLGFNASDLASFPVVGSGGLFGRVEGTDPNPHTFSRISDLRCPFSPRTLPDSPVQVLALPLGLLFYTLVTCS